MTSQLAGTVIALAGPIAAGKSTAARILASEMGYSIIRTRDVLSELAGIDGEEISDTTLQEYGARAFSGDGAVLFCSHLANATKKHRFVVIDSLRPLLHWQLMQEHLPEIRLIYIQASETLREEQYSTRVGRDASMGSYRTRAEHEVESEVNTLRDCATAIAVNDGGGGFNLQLLSLVHILQSGARPILLREMIAFVRQFHEKHGYHVGDGDKGLMSLRVGLMIEELGEIHECISKGKDGIEEEHADLLYLLIGNAVSLGFDLEAAFRAKHIVNMQREARTTAVGKRVSAWK